MKKLVDIAYTKEESWVHYLKDMFKNEDEQVSPKTPNRMTDK